LVSNPNGIVANGRIQELWAAHHCHIRLFTTTIDGVTTVELAHQVVEPIPYKPGIN
jgi:hypothetical protein